MQKAMFPMKNIRITQGYHKNSYGIDLAGKDTGKDNVIAPTDLVVKKVYTNSEDNIVWFQSVDKVKFANNEIDYLTFFVGHGDSLHGNKVGKIYKQGEVIYQEGNSGVSSGNHIELQTSKGMFTGSGWNNDNVDKKWVINNPIKAHEVYFIDDSYNVISSPYNFKKIIDEKNYTTGIYKCLANMNIRIEPTTDSKIKKVKETTKEMRKALTSKNDNDNAVIEKGWSFTALEIIKKSNEYWARNYSGYICIDDGKNIYCDKQN